MQSLRRFLLRAGVVAALASPPPPAHADEEPPSAAPAEDNGPIPRLDLAIVGGIANGNAISHRVLSFFGGRSTETHSTRLQTLDPNAVFAPVTFAGVRVWVSMPTPTMARVVFAVQERASDPPRFLVNEVTLVGGLDEVGEEQLAQVVYLSAQALWTGRVETSQEEVEQHLAQAWPAPATERATRRTKPQPSQPRRQMRWLDAGAEYVLRSRGAEGLSHGPGAIIGGAAALGDFRPGARLHLGYLLPYTAEQDELELRIVGGNVRAGFAAAWRVSESLWITPELGPGLDAVRYSPTFSDPTVAPETSRWDFRPFVYGGVDVRWLLHDVSLTFGAFLAVQLQRTHYDIEANGVRSEVLEADIVQPGAAVGVLW